VSLGVGVKMIGEIVRPPTTGLRDVDEESARREGRLTVDATVTLKFSGGTWEKAIVDRERTKYHHATVMQTLD
jgi:hypothetical protein